MITTLNTTPKISVLMPVYNSELYLREAVDSILNQTFSDFELLIIDDASTDQSVAIIQSYTDARIQLIVKPKNTGYTNSLNYGLTIARGKFIARMDSDDISLPTRFEKQIAYLEAHPDVALCGTQYQIIASEKTSKHPITHSAILVKLLEGCFIAHPTVMINNSFLRQNNLSYDVDAEPAEDYDLWSRIVFLGKVSNLDEVLLLYRVSVNQVSSQRAAEQTKSASRVKLHMLQKLFSTLPEEYIYYQTSALTLNKFLVYLNLSKLLSKQNHFQKVFPIHEFEEWINKENRKVIFNFYYKGIYNFSTLFLLGLQWPKFFKTIGFLRSAKMVLKSVINSNSSHDS